MAQVYSSSGCGDVDDEINGRILPAILKFSSEIEKKRTNWSIAEKCLTDIYRSRDIVHIMAWVNSGKCNGLKFIKRNKLATNINHVSNGAKLLKCYKYLKQLKSEDIDAVNIGFTRYINKIINE